MRRRLEQLPIALAITCLIACGSTSATPTAPTASTTTTSTTATTTPAPAPVAMRLTSSVGVDGGTLPAEFTCDGASASPPLSWSSAPPNTKEFALLMTTLPGDGTTKWNWVVWGIPATATSLERNTIGVGTFGVGSDGPKLGYQPPCSQGPGLKLYTFTLYALSASPSLPASPSQVSGAVLTTAIAPVTMATATLTLGYTRPR